MSTESEKKPKAEKPEKAKKEEIVAKIKKSELDQIRKRLGIKTEDQVKSFHLASETESISDVIPTGNIEFDRIIYNRLKPDGMYMINVIDRFQGGDFMKAFLNSLREVFPHVYLTSQGPTWQGTRSNTYVLVATKTQIDQAEFRRVVARDGIVRTDFAPTDVLDPYLAAEPRILLTDDYAPVDQLVARLFVERGY